MSTNKIIIYDEYDLYYITLDENCNFKKEFQYQINSLKYYNYYVYKENETIRITSIINNKINYYILKNIPKYELPQEFVEGLIKEKMSSIKDFFNSNLKDINEKYDKIKEKIILLNSVYENYNKKIITLTKSLIKATQDVENTDNNEDIKLVNNNNNNNNYINNNNKQINVNNSSSIDSFDVDGNNNFKFNVNKIKNIVPKLPKINLKKRNLNIPLEKKDKKILDLNIKNKSLNKYHSGTNILKHIKEDSNKDKENSPSQLQIKNLTKNFSSFNTNSIINTSNNNSNGLSEMIQFTEVESIKKINKLRKKKLQLHQRILSAVLNDNISNTNNNINKFYNNKNITEQNNDIILPHISNNKYGKFKKNYFNNISYESTEFSSNVSNYNNNINQSIFLNQGNMRINNYNNNNNIGNIPE